MLKNKVKDEIEIRFKKVNDNYERCKTYMRKIKLSPLEKEKLKKAIWRESYKRYLREQRNEKETRYAKYYVRDFNVRYETLKTDKELTSVLEKTEKKYYQVNKGLRHLRFNREINNVYYLEKDIKKEIPEVIYEKEEMIFIYDNGILKNLNVKRFYEKGGFNRIKIRNGRYVEEFYVKPFDINKMEDNFILNGQKFKKETLEKFMEESGRRIYVKA